MMFRFALVALSTLFAVPALADGGDVDETVDVTGAKARPTRPSLQLNLPEYSLISQDFNFETGLRIIMQSDDTQPMVAITAVYDEGSAADPAGKEGIAHFVEHLWFRSEHGDLPKTWDVLSELGCNLNASTAEDWTDYMSICPASSLPHLLKLESLRMTETVIKVTEEMVDTEREVVRNELRMRYEVGGSGVMRYIYDRVYPAGHPYALLGIGTHESLDNIELSDIQQFTIDHYTPENTTIVVVGDFQPDDASSLIFENFDLKLLHPDLEEKHLFRYPRPGVEKPDKDNPTHWLTGAFDPDTFDAEDPADRKALDFLKEPPKRATEPGVEPMLPVTREVGHYESPIDNKTVLVGWAAPGGYRGDDILAQVTASTAGSIMAGQLDDVPGVLHDPDYGYVLGGCFNSVAWFNSTIICYLEIDEKADGDLFAEKMIDQMALMWNPDLVQQLDYSFSRERQDALAATLRSLDRFSGIGSGARATDIAHHAHFSGSGRYHSDYMEEVMRLNASEVADYAFKWMRRDRAAKVVLTPVPDDELVLDSSESDYAGASRENDTVVMSMPVEEMTDEVIRDAIALPDFDKMLDFKLDNGLRVVVMPHGQSPVVFADVLFKGGDATEPYDFDAFARRFTDFDPEDHDPLQVAGEWTHSQYNTHSHWGIRASAGNLDGALWMIRSSIDSRHPYLDGRARWLKDAREDLESNYFSTSYWLSRLQADQLGAQGGGNPYLDYPTYDWYTDIIPEWSATDIRDYMDRKYQPANATLFIVGNIDAEEAKALAVKYFGTWESKKGVEAAQLPWPKVDAEPLPPRVVLFDAKKATQTTVSLVCPIEAPDLERHTAASLAGTVMSDQIWTALREQSGVTYGAYASVRPYYGAPGQLFVGGAIQNDAVVLAVETYKATIEKASNGEFDMDQVRRTQLNDARTYVLGQQDIPQMASRLQAGFSWGDETSEDWSYIKGYPDRLLAVDAEQMASIIKPCLGHELVTLEGPIAVIEPLLTEAGIEYEVFDVEEVGMEYLERFNPKAAKKRTKQKAKDEAKKAKKEAKEAAGAGETEDAGEPSDEG